MRKPRPDLPSACKVTDKRPRPVLLYFGLPCSVGILCDYARDNGLVEYLQNGEESPGMYLKGLMLLKKRCGIKHLRCLTALVPYSNKCMYVLVLYTNRMMGDKWPNEAKEQELAGKIKEELKLPGEYPLLWFFALNDNDR